VGRAASRFNIAMLVVGVVALGFVLDHLGWAGARRVVVGTGVWFAVIAVIDLASMMCDAFAVQGFLRAKVDITYWRVFGAQASGLAINRLTPGNSLGEPVKVTMLSRYVPTEQAVSAIVMFNLTTIYLGIAAIVVGVPVTALTLDLPPRIEQIVWISLGVLIVLAIGIAVLVRRGAVSTLVGALASIHIIGPQRAERWRAKVVTIDRRLQELGGIRRGLLGVIGSRVFNWLGTLAILYAADIPFTAPLVVAMLSVGILISWLSNVLPLGLGLADGTNYALYGLLGASPEAGLVFTMVNRLRTVLLAFMGLAIMAVANAMHRRDKRP
jgi:uncharacterized protein (TIRG00374 family)